MTQIVVGFIALFILAGLVSYTLKEIEKLLLK